MSRTYRRKNVAVPRYITHDWTYADDLSCAVYTARTTSETQKELAKYHSEGSTWFGHRPGSGFCNHYQCKHRRRAHQLLKQYMLNEETDVNIMSKPQLPYWT